MGEAKRRGSFEERKEAAIERNKITEKIREEARKDIAKLSPTMKAYIASLLSLGGYRR